MVWIARVAVLLTWAAGVLLIISVHEGAWWYALTNALILVTNFFIWLIANENIMLSERLDVMEREEMERLFRVSQN